MSDVVVYHNPRCSKSRGACQLLESSGVDFETVEYLKNPPTVSELASIARKLGLPPTAFIRSKEERFQELGLSLSDPRSNEEWFEIMADNPVLIERPIVIRGNRAVIGRPPESIKSLIA